MINLKTSQKYFSKRVRTFLPIFMSVLLLCGSLNYHVYALDTPSERDVTIDFNDVDITVFIKFVSEMTGKNFIIDRAVKGKVTMISSSPISSKDLYQIFQSVLEVYGYATIASGSIIKIVPTIQARTKNIATIKAKEAEYPEDKVVTQLVTLKHSNTEEIRKILLPLISKTSIISSHPDSGTLIITDVQSNITRLLEIIEAIDVPSIGEELVVFNLKYASAKNLADSLKQLFLNIKSKNKTSTNVRLIAYERTNSLIVLAPKIHIQKIQSLLSQLDTDVPRGDGRLHVYYLQHANADELVKVLTSLPSEALTKEKETPKTKTASVTSDIKVMADSETNSLIIAAPKEEYSVIEDVIKKLDIPRRMVYIEALIMEVDVDKDFQLGVEWGGAGSFDDETGSVYTGFSGNTDDPYSTLSGLSSDTADYPSGFLFGVMKEGIEIGNIFFPSLGAVLNAYKNDSDVNIIATPQILTTDNHEASIEVGENVPYITSLNTSTSNEDYTNYEYKDVSTSLKITPHINQENLVRLELYTQVIKLKNPNSTSHTPTTLKRTAETTVVIHDNETVVLGGIIGQDSSDEEYKVPLLGDIPLLGWLFKTQSEYQNKTNLFIFISPHIVENEAELAEIYLKKRNKLESVQERSTKIIDETFNFGDQVSQSIALSDIGFNKLYKNEYATAKQYFTQALKLAPDNAYALVNMGIIYEHEGDINKAASFYRQVLEQKITEKENTEYKNDQFERCHEIAKENLRKLGMDDTVSRNPSTESDQDRKN